MTREIKFNYIWQHNETGRFIEHIWTLEQLETGMLVDQCDYEYRRKHTLVAKRQFTGLLDKHGKEIYEGDIVVSKGYPWFKDGEYNYIDTIEWCFAGFHTVHNSVGNNRGISDGINSPLEEGECWEIIGNIYENPELLKGE